MLIINADDYGKDIDTSRRIVECHRKGRISSCTAMMFMSDTERSAEAAREYVMDVGLHLNLSDGFTGRVPYGLRDRHQRVADYLGRRTLNKYLFNPLIQKDLEYSFRSQLESFISIYGILPSHLDGHRHMHLCANVLWSGLIPGSWKVRKSFCFKSGEKSLFNRMYRYFVNLYLQKRHVCADYLFSLDPLYNGRIRGILYLSRGSDVELMVHPGVSRQMEYLMSEQFGNALSGVQMSGYEELGRSATTMRELKEG